MTMTMEGGWTSRSSSSRPSFGLWLLLMMLLLTTSLAQTKTNITIQAQPDPNQLSSKGSQAGCDHYRNGYLGLALCVNFYDDSANGK